MLSRPLGEQQRRPAIVRVAYRPIGQAVDGIALRRARLHGLQASRGERGEIEFVVRGGNARRCEMTDLRLDIASIELPGNPVRSRIGCGQHSRPECFVEAVDLPLPARWRTV